MEIESMDCLYSFQENILNGRENYEWDIIATFKIYNDFIENPPPGIPTCECPSCVQKRLYVPEDYMKEVDMIKRYIYIMWLMKSLTDKTIIDRVSRFINHAKEGQKIRKRIDELYEYIYINRIELSEGCRNIWKSKEYYYQQLFGIPYMLSRIGVPDEHYILRDITFLKDSIVGHPKASHGWFRESFKETIDLGESHSLFLVPSFLAVAGERGFL